jgi:carbon monoxide dehydrogenase subunit G
VKIDNEFTVGVPIERAWEVLTDLTNVAPCMPGAQLTGVDGDVYAGRMKVKVGPVISEYAGTATFREKDDAAHHAVIDAKGRDSRGAGNASAAIDARLEARGEQTLVIVSTDMTITGKIAQFGSGMIKEVSAKLLGQFVQNLEARLAEQESTGASTEVPSTPVGAMASADAGAATSEPGPGPGPAPAPAPSAVGAPAPEPEPLDLMSVAGAAVYKRLVPPAVAVVVVAVIVYLWRR